MMLLLSNRVPALTYPKKVHTDKKKFLLILGTCEVPDLTSTQSILGPDKLYTFIYFINNYVGVQLKVEPYPIKIYYNSIQLYTTLHIILYNTFKNSFY
jgi:hypothetical protein